MSRASSPRAARQPAATVARLLGEAATCSLKFASDGGQWWRDLCNASNAASHTTRASGPSCSRGTLLLAEEPPHSGNPGLQFLELCIPRVAACVGLVNWLVLLLNFADRPSEANPINNSAID